MIAKSTQRDSDSLILIIPVYFRISWILKAMASSQSLCLSSSEFPARVKSSLKDVYRCELLSYWLTLATMISDWLATLTPDF